MDEHCDSLSRSELQAELEILHKKINRLEKLAARSPAKTAPWRRLFFCGLALAVATLLALGLVAAQSKQDALYIDQNGNVGINQTKPERTLDVNGDTLVRGSTQISGDGVVRGQLQARGAVPASPPIPAASGVVIGDSDIYFTGTTHVYTGQGNQQGMAAIENDSKDYNALMILGRSRIKPCCNRVVGLWDKLGIGTGDPQASLDVRGNVVVNGIINATITNPMRNHMYPEGAIIYQDIFAARNAGVISRLGNPAYDDTTYRGNNLWNDRTIIKFGGNAEKDGNGAQVVIPQGYDTLWIRVLGDRWNVMHIYFLDGNREDLRNWAGGFRDANSYAPDGGLSDSYAREHQWVPIPVGRSGRVAIISARSDKDFWISGVAFSKNPWSHAAQSALGYHWTVNGGDATVWLSENWEGDSVSQVNPKTNLLLKVPVVANGRDKLLYLVERSQYDTRSAHTGITVNGRPIERLLDTYDNPFARHWNGKIYDRYLAARIPANMIPAGSRYLDVRFDMSKQNGFGLRFREIGTHDLEAPF